MAHQVTSTVQSPYPPQEDSCPFEWRDQPEFLEKKIMGHPELLTKIGRSDGAGVFGRPQHVVELEETPAGIGRDVNIEPTPSPVAPASLVCFVELLKFLSSHQIARRH